METRLNPARRSFLLAGGSLLAWAAVARASQLLPTDDALAKLGAPWRLPLGSQAVISVSGDKPDLTLSAVMDKLLAWEIPAGTSVTLRLADGEHRQPGTIRMNHPDGLRIRIVGNAQNPAACRLTWPAHTDGFMARAGGVLGMLEGVTLTRTIPGGNDNGATDNACGVVATDGGIVLCGEKVVVDGFYYGFHARHGGFVRCDGTRVLRAGDAGYFAYAGGHLAAQRTEALSCSDKRIQLGSGFVAEYGGTIDATGAHAAGNALAGFNALSSGSIIANRTVSESNERHGYRATTNGVIVAHDAISRNNPEGISMTEGGRVSGHRFSHANQKDKS